MNRPRWGAREGAGMAVKRRAGFSLFELLLALSIIVLATTLTVLGFASLTRGLGTPSMEQVVRDAVREARYAAAAGKAPVILRWDSEAAAFRIAGGGDAEGAVDEVASKRDPAESSLEVSLEVFLPRVGIQADPPPETTRPVELLTFAPSGMSPAFRVRWKAQGEEAGLRFDPFSNLTIENREKRP